MREDSSNDDNQKKRFLITGANSGVGWDACRQLADLEDVESVYMACRSRHKAMRSIERLSTTCNFPEKLEYLHFDASESQEEISKSILESAIFGGKKLDGIVLNAGGMGHDASMKPVGPNHVMDIVQINVIGHIHLVNILHEKNLLAKGCRIIFSGSESARGIPMFLAPAPPMEDSKEFYLDFITGKSKTIRDPASMYAATKGVGTLYFAAFAKEFPQYYVLTVSPGGTLGTSALQSDAIPWIGKWIVYLIWMIAYCLGRFQALEQGAEKYVQALYFSESEHPSGSFLACSTDLAGPLCNQELFAEGRVYSNNARQRACYEVLSSYLK